MDTEIKTSDKFTTHLTSDELAKRLRVHPQTPRKWRMMGYGPRCIKAGRKVLYSLSEIEAWEKANTFRSTAEG